MITFLLSISENVLQNLVHFRPGVDRVLASKRNTAQHDTRQDAIHEYTVGDHLVTPNAEPATKNACCVFA